MIELPKGQSSRALFFDEELSAVVERPRGHGPQVGGDSALLVTLEACGQDGTRRKDLQEHSGLRGGTFDRALKALLDSGAAIRMPGGRYVARKFDGGITGGSRT